MLVEGENAVAAAAVGAGLVGLLPGFAVLRVHLPVHAVGERLVQRIHLVGERHTTPLLRVVRLHAGGRVEADR
ncbi:hypothetical protein D3C81_2302350 [compost metagenome]